MSANFQIDVSTDMAGVRAMVASDIKKALPILTMQIMEDCNYFCKQDKSGLISSSHTSSDVSKGNIIWDTMYANRQYWLPATCTDVNSNASYMWCHKAYDKFGKDWEAMLQKLTGG